jgi:hypothetical protein
MKIPYPSVDSGLAVSAHMYICKDNKDSHYEYVKCQTLKPKMLGSNIIKHYVDEKADISRNPFQRTTRIDCDKVFTTRHIKFSDKMKTISRPDVCVELYAYVLSELEMDGFQTVALNEKKLESMNPLIHLNDK